MVRAAQPVEGRVALVTGGGRGIGRAIALSLAGAGASVAVNYLSRSDDAESTCEQIRRGGGKAVAIAANVADATDATQLCAEVKAQLGPVAILVNNAGITQQRSLLDLVESDWDRMIAVNLKSAFLVTQALLPDMRKARWGRLIFISSAAAQTGGVVGPHYAASKAGLIGLAHSYARLLAAEGITANAIAPALIETEMLTARKDLKPTLIPVGRFGSVEELADVALMLARNGYVTGQTINVNGGAYMS